MYFDLNERSRAGQSQAAGAAGGGAGAPLGAPGRAGGAAAAAQPAGAADMSLAEQLAMYVFIVLGVLFAPLMNQIANGTALPKELVSLPIVIGAALIGLIIIPTIWEKVGAKQDAPLIVRLALFFQNGVFWQAALGTIYAAASGSSAST